MDEQRLQAYQQLIQQLLSCPDGEKAAILQANTELLDADFLQMVVEVAENFTQKGEENNANRLMALGSEPSEALDISLHENIPKPETLVNEADIDTYLQFLLEVLQDHAKKILAEAETEKAESIVIKIVNFSNLIQEFPLGKKASNMMEIAITGYEIALTIFTRVDFPEDWAATQNNLGNAYSQRIRGDKTKNIEQAITAFSAALEVYTHPDSLNFPQDWAMTQNNLGNAYRDRIKGDPSENLEIAIKAYTAALQIYRRNHCLPDWAMTQNNLGIAYTDRKKGNPSENLEIAIEAYTRALEVRTLDDFPRDWATTQNNLGIAYKKRIKGVPSDNLESAIKAYTKALEVRTRTNFPQDHAETLLNLGIAYQKLQQFDLAYSTFVIAIATVEDLRGEIISGEDSKRKQAEKYNQLYRRIVQVCLALGKETEAIEYAERSKTRNLVEEIINRDLKTIFPPNVVTQLEQLRDEIASGQNLLQTGKAENTTFSWQHLQKLRQQRQQLQDTYLPIGSSFNFASLEKIVDDNTAIIEWYITFDKIIAFVIQPGGKEIKIWESSSEDREALRDWINEYLTDYYNQKDQWQNQLEESLQNLAVILHIEEILEKIPPQCEKLILIPHQFLHLLPLHALPVRNSYLMDLFPQGVGYAPSLQVLQQVQLRQRPNFQSLFAIQNPTENLVGADLEIESIKQYFSPQKITVLRGKEADRNALDSRIANLAEANCLHFSCHGSFNLETPADSCLLLNGVDVDEEIDLNKCLTLGDLFNKEFNLNQCRLVVLSACETGLIDFNNVSDEYIGLPSGFLYAGSSSVVSSLWKVDDVSTAFLMIHFYQNLHAAFISEKDVSVASVLNKSQHWLRNATKENMKKFVSTLTLDSTWNDEILDWFDKIETEYKPFESLFHWAAFIAVGN
ncbi:CHAT domain-containing protein [Dolichospermum sp. UHCC 0352]|uniref:CHAT domain-containing protein n=1 Tax=Dolichospermum sp. UHCC 0352 TaxID=2590011 RepID=UPI001445313F|nr:CHAT domain-containing tetratricopeptide repeat protein [Dolichospermum sp. UHCC 0352]MTJ23173.1 CHAT domain-containing protein [Dolichospermum sp. UHCC 0352]